jgi:hypothetical protein
VLEAELRIVLILQSSGAAILDESPGSEIGEIVDIFLEAHLLLADGLLAEERRRNEKLRDVRPCRFTGEGAPEQQARGDLAAASDLRNREAV